MSKAKLTKVSVALPGITGEWVADDVQRSAAWEMYVELVTRISLQPLAEGDGLLGEALASLHVLFEETRRILRSHGPSVAVPEKKRLLSFGAIAVDVLNVWLRPFLARWHTRLADHESRRAPTASLVEHERIWNEAAALRRELADLRTKLVAYADLLAEACGVASLHAVPEPATDPATPT
jgi:hypothetical protein